MSLLPHITVLVLTYDEAPNIGRTLAALTSFPKVVVLDSGSTDGTQEIVGRFANTRLCTRPFDSHGAQWSHGLNECGIETEWVLALDADYVLPEALVAEIAALRPPALVAGYRASFDYLVFGRPLSGTLYPPVIVLYRRDKAHYIQIGHTHRLKVEGEVGALEGRIAHEDRKPISRWFASQQSYARLEADFLLGAAPSELRFSDRVRRLAWPAPILVFWATLLGKRCVLDGWRGWYYVLQRTLTELMIAIEIIDRRIRPNAADTE